MVLTSKIPMHRCLRAYFCGAVSFGFSVVKNCYSIAVLCPAKQIASYWTLSLGRRISLLYAVTFLLILPVIFHDARHSAFYLHVNKTALKESMKHANSRRIVQAEKYFSSLNGSGLFDQHMPSRTVAVDHVTVAITIITVSRNRHEIDSYEPKYLTQIVWKFHSLLVKWRQRNQRLRVQLSICNVDSMVASYDEAHKLSKFVPVFSRFNNTHFSFVHTLEKEKQDYVFCMNKSMEINADADYVFLVEDDALPIDDLFDVLQHVLLMHTERSFVCGEFRTKPSNIAFVKFYHPEWLLSFISIQPERLPELFSYAAILSTLLTVVYAITSGFTTTRNMVTVDTCWRSLFLFSLIVMLACGRTGVSEWRRLASPVFYSYTPAPSCCTPAMLFPRSAALLTVNYLNNSTCGNNFGKDSVLDKMLKDLQMTAYLVQPNMFTHIGVYSSLRLRIVDPLMV